MLTIAGISCFAIGVYAGKKRAGGCGWGTIAMDFCRDTKDVAVRTWSTVSAPFKKGNPDVVDGELVHG